MQRVLVIYNSRSSRFKDVQVEVLNRLKELKGCVVGKYEISPEGFNKNVAQLSKMFRDGDFVIAAGGDATAAVTINAVLKSDKDVVFAALPYGNFNDLARTLKLHTVDDIFKVNPSIKKLYPLAIYVDDKLWRYASCYVTIGMTAEAVELFDDKKIRKNLQKGHKSSWRSYIYLARWYFKNRRAKVFLPEFKLNGQPTKRGVSDYCALSGASMCRVMKGGDDYLKPRVFRSENCRLISFWRLFKLMAQSILYRTPGSETTGDVLEFMEPATVELQAEGEYQVFSGVHKIEVKKLDQYIKIIQN